MTVRVRSARQFVAARALLVGCALALVATAACRRPSSTPTAAAEPQVPYPPMQPLASYEQDPEWRHRVGILGGGTAGAEGAADSGLSAQLQEVGFGPQQLAAPPADGGQYNTMLEVAPGVIDARVLSPVASGRYEQQAGEPDQAFYSRVVASLQSVLQPEPVVEEEPEAEEPPPPDPKEVCRSDCETKSQTCTMTCCEKELGSDGSKCEAAKVAAERCEQECQAKESGVDKCLDGCRRGKHSAYSWDTSIARDGSVVAKCNVTCGEELSECITACDNAPAPGEGGDEGAQTESEGEGEGAATE